MSDCTEDAVANFKLTEEGGDEGGVVSLIVLSGEGDGVGRSVLLNVLTWSRGCFLGILCFGLSTACPIFDLSTSKGSLYIYKD